MDTISGVTSRDPFENQYQPEPILRVVQATAHNVIVVKIVLVLVSQSKLIVLLVTLVKILQSNYRVYKDIINLTQAKVDINKSFNINERQILDECKKCEKGHYCDSIGMTI